MKVVILKNPNEQNIADILNLFRDIKGRTCSAKAFLTYLDACWSDICLVGILDGESVVGFTVATRPSILEPKIGRLPFSSVKKGVKQTYVQQGLVLAEQWFRECGAEKYYFESVRSAKALKRAFDMVPSKEVIYEKYI